MILFVLAKFLLNLLALNVFNIDFELENTNCKKYKELDNIIANNVLICHTVDTDYT